MSTDTQGVVTAASEELRQIDPILAEPWPGLNPRKHFDEEEIGDIAESIRENGVMQNLVLHDRTHGGTVEVDGVPYWIVSGERRWRGAMIVGALIPVRIRIFTEAQALKIALLENIQRSNLTLLEEARGLKKWLKLDPDMTQELVADEIGKSQSHVANLIRLLQLPDDVLAFVENGSVNHTWARDLLLPFVRIPEKPRTQFFKSVVRDLTHEQKTLESHGLGSHRVHEIAANAAAAIGKQLIRPGGTHIGLGERTLVTTEIHKTCTCNAPMKYDYNHHGAAFCFDEEWWTNQQKAARKEKEKKRKAEREKKEARGSRVKEQAAEVSAKGEMSGQQFTKKYGYSHSGNYAEIVDRFNGGRISNLVDVAQLPAASFVVVGEEGGAHWLACVDMKAYATARQAIEAEKQGLVSQRRAEQLSADRAELLKEALTPRVVAELFRRHGVELEVALSRVAADLGLEFGDVDNWGRFRHTNSGLNPDTTPVGSLEDILKLFALRSRRGDFKTNRDAIVEAVDRELTAKYEPAIRAFLPIDKKEQKRRAHSASKAAQLSHQIGELIADKTFTSAGDHADKLQGLVSDLEELKEDLDEVAAQEVESILDGANALLDRLEESEEAELAGAGA